VTPKLFLETHGSGFDSYLPLLRALKQAVRGVDKERDLTSVSGMSHAYDLWTPAGGIEWSLTPDAIRERLLSGEIDRSSHVRKVEKKPDDVKGSKGRVWLEGRRFRRIGDTIANDEVEVRSLYDPVGAYASDGTSSGAGAGLLAGLLLVIVLAFVEGRVGAIIGGVLIVLCVPVATKLLMRGQIIGAVILWALAAAGVEEIRKAGNLWLMAGAAAALLALPVGLGALIGRSRGKKAGMRRAQTDRILPIEALREPKELDPAGYPVLGSVGASA